LGKNLQNRRKWLYIQAKKNSAMKKILMGVCLGIVITATLSFKVIQDKSNAKVQKIQGVYIFIKSEPQLDYEIIGSMKGPTFGSHEFDDLLEAIIKKQKKEFPQGEGILFDGSIKQTHNTNVSIIKFK
jgi:hypothetical protein